MMDKKRYLDILQYICEYYGICQEQLINIMKLKNNKYMLLLLLKNNNCFDKDKLKEILDVKNKNSIDNSLKKAQKKFLINVYFRREYLFLEENLRKMK